jgi:hypothetical protein
MKKLAILETDPNASADGSWNIGLGCGGKSITVFCVKARDSLLCAHHSLKRVYLTQPPLKKEKKST